MGIATLMGKFIMFYGCLGLCARIAIAFQCKLKPDPIMNYVCDARRCITDVFGQADPNLSFCCYCDFDGLCTKTSKYQHGAPLDGTTVSCLLTADSNGTGPVGTCTKDSDCNLRWTCKNKQWVEGVFVGNQTDIEMHGFHEVRWPYGLPPVCTSPAPSHKSEMQADMPRTDRVDGPDGRIELCLCNLAVKLDSLNALRLTFWFVFTVQYLRS